MVLPQLGWLTKSALWKSENWATLWFGTHRIWTTSATALEAIWSKKLSKEAEWYRRAMNRYYSANRSLKARLLVCRQPNGSTQTARLRF